jgi:divalent metal cation (Fe/Co/Zn/Cd) transporter
MKKALKTIVNLTSFVLSILVIVLTLYFSWEIHLLLGVIVSLFILNSILEKISLYLERSIEKDMNQTLDNAFNAKAEELRQTLQDDKNKYNNDQQINS